MSKAEITMWASIAAAFAAVIGLFFSKAQLVASGDDGNPFNFPGSTGPTFNFGGRGEGGSGRGIPLPVPGPSVIPGCGCGSSGGDFAAPALSPVFGQSIELIPGEARPQPMRNILPEFLPG